MSHHLFLDLTAAELPHDWPEHWPRRIPVRPGRAYAEYDVCEELMPRGWREEFEARVAAKGDRMHPDAHRYRIGVNHCNMPRGARIVQGEGEA